MLTFLKTTVDDASADQRAKISAIYVLLLPANVLVWISAGVALAGRPTLIGTAFLAYVPGLRHAVDADRLDRRCRAQADAGGQTSGLCRPFLLPRPFAGRARLGWGDDNQAQ